MKKRLLIACAALFSSFGFSQTTATDFTANDCNGTSHNLFAELNSGKVIVLCWVMPCLTCLNPAKTAYDAVQSYATSNPGKVVFYLLDDTGETPCGTITTWGNANHMGNAVSFSTPAINPADYGNVGMPKIVIIGGWGHSVFYNEDDGNNLTGIQPAINQALTASGIDENNSIVSGLKIFPNSVKNKATLVYYINQTHSFDINIVDVTGKNIKTLSYNNQTPGKYETLIDFESVCDGLYFLKLNTGSNSKILKFVVTH